HIARGEHRRNGSRPNQWPTFESYFRDRVESFAVIPRPRLAIGERLRTYFSAAVPAQRAERFSAKEASPSAASFDWRFAAWCSTTLSNVVASIVAAASSTARV